MYKKIKVLIITLIILLMTTGISHAVTGNPKVDWLIKEGYVTGDSNGFRLKDKITRAETTKMVVEAGGLGEYVDGYKYLVSMFKDMTQKHWANGYINVAVINTLVNGYPDGSFKPSNNITYAEIIKMLVMAKGDKPDTDLYTGSLWAVPYIVKAEELGITDGVNITSYYENATREKVFELVFNAMFKEEPLEFEIYNGIVVENERVSKLKNNQISLIIFEDLNTSSELKPRYKVYEKIIVTLPDEVEDVEYLLGKVVDITIDNNNVATKVRVDNSYSYLEGPILAGQDYVYLGSNGKYYDVNIDGSSSNRIEGILGVYHNDREYNYDEYIENLGDNEANGELVFIAEYAKITVKNGITYFLDSYTFSDIAPVSDVSRDGSDIYVYDDAADASIIQISINNVIGYTYDWGLETLESENIRKGDIVHIYNRDSAIVRRDSKKYGEFYDLTEESSYYFADINGNIHQVRTSDDRRPIYSVDNSKYKTLFAEDPNNDFYSLFDEEVMYLIDINGHIQAITIR